MDFEDLRVRLPDWVYGFIELGWKNHNGIVAGLRLTNIFPFVEAKPFDSFEEYAVAVVEGLVRADYERFMKEQREHLNRLDDTILKALNKCLEKEEERRLKEKPAPSREVG